MLIGQEYQKIKTELRRLLDLGRSLENALAELGALLPAILD